jgi:hypothetical protein
MTDSAHTPRPEFRAQLEWEITRTLRREARLGVHRRERQRRWLRVASIAALCVAVGTASGFASAQVRDVARRDSLLEAARAELALIALRVELARAQFDIASQRAQMGALDAAGVALAEAELQSMQARAARAQLNIEEIQAASQPPRDELSAPLVGGRDFVKERIQLDLVNAQKALAAAERAVIDVARRVRMGTALEVARVEAEVDLARARGTLTVLAERLSLRREFVEKGTAAANLATRLEAAQLREDMRVAQQSLNLARTRAQTVERQRSMGTATELELMRAQIEVKERELELSQLTIQLRRLEVRRDTVP